MFGLNTAKLTSLCLRSLAGKGYDLEQVPNDAASESRARRVRDKDRSGPFDLKRNDFSDSAAFWLFLRYEGKDVAFAAARVESLNKGEVASYIHRSYSRLYPEYKVDAQPKSTELTEAISGRVVYLGELYFTRDHTGDKDKLRCFCLLLFSLCVSDLRADWIYAFIPKKHDALGYGRVYGFRHFDDCALVWQEVPISRRHETLCAISARQLEETASHFAKHPSDLSVPIDL